MSARPSLGEFFPPMHSINRTLHLLRSGEIDHNPELRHALYNDLRDFLWHVEVIPCAVGVEVRAYVDELDSTYYGHGLTEEAATQDLLCHIVDQIS